MQMTWLVGFGLVGFGCLVVWSDCLVWLFGLIVGFGCLV